MKKLEMLYEGKAKKVYKTDDENVYIVEYKDDATAFNGLKKGTIAGKGVINNRMSNLMFRLLEEKGIPTHYIEELSDRETAVRRVEIVPLEVIVRNVAAGSFSKRYGVPEGSALNCTILEYSYKNDELGDPLINDYHAIALGLATREELDQIAAMTFAVNDALRDAIEGFVWSEGPCTRSEIMAEIRPMLPTGMTESQVRNKVDNLLRYMVKHRMLSIRGARSRSATYSIIRRGTENIDRPARASRPHGEP